MSFIDKRTLVVCLLSLAAARTTAGAENTPEVTGTTPTPSTNQCRLWLAPSSTGTEHEPKLGLFAGVDYDLNAPIGKPEFAIPLVDFVDSWNRANSVTDQVVNFLEGFLWTGEYAGARWEGYHSSTVAIPGYGIMANYHSGTHNVDWLQGAVLLRDDSVFEAGKAHPSRGAITTYSNLTMVATQPIKAGMELFANFGEVWDGNHTDDVFQDKLTRWDYQDADKILDKVLAFIKKYDEEMTPQLKDDVLDFIMDKVLGTAAGSHAKVIRSLIPAHPGKLQTVKDMGGTFAYRNPDLVKTKKWLEKHGTCMDNIEARPSTIPGAGRGAFATRSMKKGTVIAPMPMLHIATKNVMDTVKMNEKKDDDGVFYEPDTTKIIGKQLAINYCFGHPESSMLLFPVASTVSQINHSPEPNARITWSKNKHWGNAHDWHDATIERCAEEQRIGIVMEVYAIKDINAGDEVTIDYGAEWSAAWEAHMSSFDATKEWPLKAIDMKALYKNKPFKTLAELTSDPYPEGIDTSCFVSSDDMTDGKHKVNAQGDERRLWRGPNEFKDYSGQAFFRCTVIESTHVEEGNLYNYTVSTMVGDNRLEIVGIPHRAITFIDAPYASDIFSPEAFRHYIGIPDVIFPQAWRDLRG